MASLAAFLFVSSVAPPAWAQAEQESGDAAAAAPRLDSRGIELAEGRLWVSAFFNLAFEALDDHPEEVNLDDIGVLARYEVSDRLALFAAVEIEDFATWTDGEGTSAASERPAVERLYADVALSPQSTLRIGKTLSPFGIWNPIRRAPLTWTVERPLVTEISFPLHSTGLMVTRRGGAGLWSIDGDLYVQPAGELDRISDEKAADGLVGGRASVARPLANGFATAGLNAAYFEDRDSGDQEYAVGLDVDLTLGRERVTAEIVASDGEVDDDAVQWGGYVQAVHPLWRGLFAVVRGEVVGLRGTDDFTSVVLGLAYRSDSGRWMLKVNYQFSNNAVDDRSDGPSVALSLLF